MEFVLRLIKKIIPGAALNFMRKPYHYFLAFIGALMSGFPSNKIIAIAVTGTKGKSSVVELISAIFEKAGYKTASASTIQFKIGETIERNMHKMTMPGRFFLQRFLKKAVDAGCTYAVIEMTSEGAKQFRHKFIELNALVFTNLAPEHIESHGSYENYVNAKVSLARALEASKKKDKKLIVNADDKEAQKFLQAFSGPKFSFSNKDAYNARISDKGVSFGWSGNTSNTISINSELPGEFNLYNILAAITCAKAFGVSLENIKTGIEKIKSIRGRAEKINGVDFSVIVDYAHTPDSLEKLYQTYAGKYKICLLGNTGGGRDKWKRPIMAKIAEKHCDEIILTNEDPYDEDPEEILKEMSEVIKNKELSVIFDRRHAIQAAISRAGKDDIILITGKGTDPYIMGPKGSKISWDDASVVKEELELLKKSVPI